MGFNMKDLQRMQAKLMKMQEDLQNSSFDGTSGGDAVRVTRTGRFEITAIKLSQEVVDPEDVGMLEDLILAACQDAFGKVLDEQQKIMTSMTGGMKLPPGMGF
jgi:DNA-binding YbaB/EbfC family protein